MNLRAWRILLGTGAILLGCSGETSTTTPDTVASVGKATNACGPTDGAAISVSIGAQPMCTDQPPGDAPQADFYAYPASAEALVAGQSWSYDASTASPNLGVRWYPAGPSGTSETPASASLEIVSVTDTQADVHYELVTAAGKSYAGDATVAICMVQTICG